jgi:D-serine dehydratase
MERSQAVRSSLVEGAPTFWIRETEPTHEPDVEGHVAVLFAVERWRRFAPLLAALFAADVADGKIESPLREVRSLVAQYSSPNAPADLGSRVLVKCDHALPLTGSIKARGGVYEVLRIAERSALRAGILRPDQPYDVLATPAARNLFATQRIVVGSTGNLGFAVGCAARALGFHVDVHMSRDAKPWKKLRLTGIGATVIEHAADYSSAVAAAREASATLAESYFIDDERSADLFFGYSAAAAELAGQLQGIGVTIDADHPLCVYLPCGVGGAPAGVLYGLRALLGPHVWGFFAEPTAAPCMMLRLIGMSASASVYDLGLDNRTIADGLAVARASDFAYEMIGTQMMGAYTVTDAQMLTWLAAAAGEGMRLEPAAATGFAGALHAIWQLPMGPLTARLARATHIIWTTGGSLLPDAEYADLMAITSQTHAAQEPR